MTSAGEPIAIWTIGHSNHPFERFLELLRGQGIEMLVDVRSAPYARYAVHFTHDVLREAIAAAGIAYVYLGDQIGGRPRDPALLRADGRADYGRIAATPAFAEGIARVLDMAAVRRVALMCGEECPADCHRRRLLGRELEARGARMLHIRGHGRVETEHDLLAEEARASGGQLALFDPDTTG